MKKAGCIAGLFCGRPGAGNKALQRRGKPNGGAGKSSKSVGTSTGTAGLPAVQAKADANAKVLADHAIDADFLTETQALADAFQKGLPDTQSLLDARQNANATYEEVHEAQMTQIYELDKAMSIFETVNPELSKGYKSARALVNSAGGKSKKPKGEKGA